MDQQQLKKNALKAICGQDGSGNIEEMKKIFINDSFFPSLTNQAIDGSGLTVLMFAVQYNHLKIIEYLLTLPQLFINQRTFMVGNTALHIASEYGNIEALQLLLSDRNIDINIQNSSGLRAIDVCCAHFTADQSKKGTIIELFQNHVPQEPVPIAVFTDADARHYEALLRTENWMNTSNSETLQPPANDVDHNL